MKLSYNWLNDYIDISDIDIHELANLLTMKTCEVEEVTPFMPWLGDFPVALVESLEQHPNADKLKVCQVNNGKEVIQIVTGAANVEAGKKYPLAPIGSTLPNGMELKKGNLRGLDSFGMLCSAGELELEDFLFGNPGDSIEDGLLTLPDSFVVGHSLKEEIGSADYIIDIDNKSITHRPDLWSHYGFARELSAILGRPLKRNISEFSFPETSALDAQLPPKKVVIEDNAALNYSSAVFSGIEIKSSPFAVQTRLLAAGMRPINNVVDASNYAMLDMGQPNHAFDYNFLKKDIHINFAKKGEKVTTLDDKERELSDGIVLIRDGSTPVAVGGVMGGAHTEVTSDTQSLFFESATFQRSHIRHAVARLGLRSEASMRFEKGQDISNAIPAIYRFGEILKQSVPNLQMGTIHSERKAEPARNVIETTYSLIRTRLGAIELSNEKIDSILKSLGIDVKTNGDSLTATIPTYRSNFDLTIPEDLVEETGRMIGYREIQPLPFMVSCEMPQYRNSMRELEHRLRDLMSESFQFNESYNYDFHSEAQLAMDTRFCSKPVRLENPIQSDLPYMRVSPLPGLLGNIAANYRESDDLRFFEIERIFISAQERTELPEERYFLAAALTSSESPEKTMRSLASVISELLTRIGLPRSAQHFSSNSVEIFHPGRVGIVSEKSTGREIVRWGQVHPRLTAAADIEKEVYYFELFLKELYTCYTAPKHLYRPLVRYPGTDFELTVVAEELIPFAQIHSIIGTPSDGSVPEGETYLEKMEYLGEYRGEPIPAGKKAVSFRLHWRNRSRTLTGDEIQALQKKIIDNLNAAGFPLRS